jgi:hypothetical protein
MARSVHPKELKRADIADQPDLLRLVEEVRRTGQPVVLRRGDEDLAVLRPLGPKPVTRQMPLRRAGQTPKRDSLFDIIGMFSTEGPTDVSEHKHEYLAEAYWAEFNPPKEP